MEQFEQLLTCCVCLDRYRIPKLLPCQHSFCMEPCMEGLVDYVRRQVKCPECRAEHRIPYNGVQAFPTNVTLQRFLELHIEITGELPDPTSGQIMERCGVCSEKAYLSHCAHCEKKICDDCKSAHMDILRREITRFNSQIRRSLHRLQDSLAIIEKNTLSLQTNAISVTEEIDEIYRRITKAIKDRSDQLKGEIDRYLAVELRNLTTLKENLDLEINNITSNCDIVDKYMNETVEWDDCELMDTKEIFLKTVEFLRHFEYENADYSRRVRFMVSIDPNQLVMNLATFGDLNITPHSAPGSSVSSSHLAPPTGLQPGLMRSKSDHRLATQFRQQEERGGYNDEPVLGGRKFGERPVRTVNPDRYGDAGSRYGRSDYDYDNEYENEQSSRAGKSSRFRSRFVRSHQNDDSDSEQQQQQRQELDKRKDRVLDSEDVSRGQLSGIIRLSDCARVVQRLADIGKEKKEKKSDAAAAAQANVQAAIQAQKAAMQRQKQAQQPPAAQRQVSEDDELARQKRQNKNAPAGSSTATPTASTPAAATSETGERPNTDRVTALKRGGQAASEESDSSTQAASPVRTAATRAESKPPMSAQVAAVKKTQRSGSSDSTASTESSASSGQAAAASSSQKAPSTARYSTAREASTTAAAATTPSTPEKKPFVSRFLPQHSGTSAASNGAADKKKAESDSSSEEETSSESESESEPETKPKTGATSSSANKSTPSSVSNSTSAATTASSSSTSSYRDRLEARRASRDDTGLSARSSAYATPSSSGYGSSSTTTSTPRTRAVPAPHHATDNEDRYGSGSNSGSSVLPFSVPYISRPYRARYRQRLADVSREVK
ncbi:RING finger protein nhl-1 isoform X6 [Scaptodrosophila lebanonensis]|uniref:RING finger protein nhl-1 isoform X6 n=1 Tax=Drosophila lebanonensis TaxID=7225 RepID=A0A6J2UL27_DROLE|nr:RING finger protein nhl-1 isoform X6 [Scaptodrosophila lebanonensis]